MASAIGNTIQLTAEQIAERLNSGVYATCSTASSAAAKVATTPDEDFQLVTGAVVFVRFTYYNSASSPTLNVDGTGAIAIKAYGSTAVSTYMWHSGAVAPFVYNGTYWVLARGGIASTTYYGLVKLSSAVDSTSTALAATPSAVKKAYDLADGKCTVETYSVEIAASDWSSNSVTVTVSGITADSAIIVSPDPSSYSVYATAGVRCSAQAANSLTFVCDSAPSAAITVNVLQLA